jgi:hypothetical protein
MDGKIVEEWVDADMMGLMQQIGAIPSARPSAASDGVVRLSPDSDRSKA